MASHESAVKAHRQSLVKREANRQYRSRLRSALRSIRTAIDSGDPAKVKDALRNTISLVDKMAGKKVIHRNAAARYKSRLASRVSKRGTRDSWRYVFKASSLKSRPFRRARATYVHQLRSMRRFCLSPYPFRRK